jgi:hypothetical protein
MNQFDLETWFPDAIRYFRAFGFFENYHTADDEVAKAIKSYWQGDWDDFLSGARDPASADQLLLVADTQRVWWQDLEGVYRGANYYASALSGWAVISRGQFHPEHIQETWLAENSPVQVTFVLNGSQHVILHRSGDFLDRGILKLINQTLINTPFRCEVAVDYGDSNWITILNREEKRRLIAERGWHFLR